MSMDPLSLEKAAESLVAFGKILAAEGLVARTWGNLSLRLGDYMLITPSGLAYEDLVPASMVAVRFSDLSWEGDTKPSSEKDLHSRVYLANPECRAIFHTHQNHASALAATRRSFPVTKGEHRRVLGLTIPCADYALPTTTALAKAVERLIRDQWHPAVLLANHGTICMGSSPEHALELARTLEDFSRELILDTCQEKTGMDLRNLTTLPWRNESDSQTSAPAIFLRKDDKIGRLDAQGQFSTLNPEQVGKLQGLEKIALESLRASRKNQVAMVSTELYTQLQARRGSTLHPYLDDMAQLLGPRVKVQRTPKSGLHLGANKVALIRGQGAICLATDRYELQALAMVLEKSCLASFASELLENTHGISLVESLLMRVIFLLKYGKTARSKQSGEKQA